MGEDRQIRDPVFGFIKLHGKEADIVNSKIFQRLRGIRQLAFAFLVYPGALHTRFDHSLGVFHIAGLLSESLKLSRDERELVQITALLHDLGHGPFSHVSENALEIYTDRDKITLDKKEKIHEAITAEIIRSDPDLKHILGASDCDKIISLLSKGYGEPYLRSIVSGPLDADKQDYLLRDSYFCGVKYGIFDIHQLHRELIIKEDPADDSKNLMVTPEGIHSLEQFVLAKYYLTTQVYRHRVRLITDQMLTRSICLGIEVDKIDEMHQLFSYDGSPEFLERYKQWDDARFLFEFQNEKFKGTCCNNLLNRLYERRLLKKVYEKRINALPEECRDPITRITVPENRDNRQKLELIIFETIKKNCNKFLEEEKPEFTIINIYNIKSVRVQSRDDEGSILIDRKPNPNIFEQESSLFRSIDETISEMFCDIYAPVFYETPQDRRGLIANLDEPITQALQSFFSRRGGG